MIFLAIIQNTYIYDIFGYHTKYLSKFIESKNPSKFAEKSHQDKNSGSQLELLMKMFN